jgi:hypothetical protein
MLAEQQQYQGNHNFAFARISADANTSRNPHLRKQQIMNMFLGLANYPSISSAGISHAGEYMYLRTTRQTSADTEPRLRWEFGLRSQKNNMLLLSILSARQRARRFEHQRLPRPPYRRSSPHAILGVKFLTTQRLGVPDLMSSTPNSLTASRPCGRVGSGKHAFIRGDTA